MDELKEFENVEISLYKKILKYRFNFYYLFYKIWLNINFALSNSFRCKLKLISFRKYFYFFQ